MQQKYSNFRAMLALVKASLQSTLKSPSAIVFTIAFPLVFILVFGFLGGGKQFQLSVVPAKGIDTTAELYTVLHNSPVLKWVDAGEETDEELLSNGEIVAIVDIQSNADTPKYTVSLKSAAAQKSSVEQLKTVINNAIQSNDPVIQERTSAVAEIDVVSAEVREFKKIDFILPGQLGFSLLAGSVFGTAFVFLNLRDTLVLKRFFATPVRREIIVISEGVARTIYQLLGAVVILLVGYFALDYTLIHGFVTFFEMILLSAFGIMVFMRFVFLY